MNIINEATIPMTDYGYWISQYAEIYPVGNHGHEPFIRSVEGCDSATAMKEGWVRVVTVRNALQAEACFPVLKPRVKAKLMALARSEDFSVFMADNHTPDGDYTMNAFHNLHDFIHGIEALSRSPALTESCDCLTHENIMEGTGDQDTLDHLKAKYEEFNRLYFDNRLPIIPIAWGNMKNAGAAVTFSSATHKGMRTPLPETMKMVFSNKYKRTAEELEPILLHEMIHVYFIAIDLDADENHGSKFMSMLRKLTQQSGISIPLKDTGNNLELNDSTIKPVGVVLRRFMSGGKIKYAYAMFSAKVLGTKIADLEARFSRNRSEQVEAFIVTSPLWSEKSQRSRLHIKINYKTNYFIPKPEEVDDLFSHGKIIWSNEVSM